MQLASPEGDMFSAAMQGSSVMAGMASAGMGAATGGGAAGGSDMMGQQLFIRHPGLEQMIKDKIATMLTAEQAKDVQAGKVVILDAGMAKEVIIPGGMYHMFRAEVAKLIFHIRLKHVLPYTFTVEKVVGPKDASEAMTDFDKSK